MKPSGACAPCLLHWLYERVAVHVAEKERFQVMNRILNVLSAEFHPTANLGLVCNKTIDSVYDFTATCPKHYTELKSKNNRFVTGLLPAAKDFITKGKTSRDRFERACYLASAGNVAPMGAPSDGFTFHEVQEIIAGNYPFPVLMGDIYDAVQGASQILYVADNAGEIGFDSLVMAQLKEMGLIVILIVKGPHLFEDAAMEDASFFGLDKLVDSILTTKGLFVPSKCSPPLANAFRESDLLFVKGTGNYEASKETVQGKSVIYMLKVKCKPVAEKVETEIGNFIVRLEK
ncbi:MAG: ARMT1-like domain-containing protein [Desulfobacteraceae bacterium]